MATLKIYFIALLACPFVSSMSREQASQVPKAEVILRFSWKSRRLGLAFGSLVASLAYLLDSTAVALTLRLHSLYLVLIACGRAGLLPHQTSAE